MLNVRYVDILCDFLVHLLQPQWWGTKDKGYRTRKMSASLVNLILYWYWCVTRVNEFVKTFKQHDTTADCSPGGSAGNYIMFARATSGDKPNNRRFSPCSRSKMNAVMEVKGRCQDSKCCFKGTVSYLFKMYYGNSSLNPLSSNIHKQILQTDLYTFL